MTTTNNIANWPALLTNVPDAGTQKVQLPPPFDSVSPFMAAPTEVDTTGATQALDPHKWATQEWAEFVAAQLGGMAFAYTSETPQFWYVPDKGVTYNQLKWFVQLTGEGTSNPPAAAPFLLDGITDPADLAMKYGNTVAVMNQALPEFLGIVQGG